MTTRIQRCCVIAAGFLMLAQARSLPAALWIGTDLDTLSKNAEVIVEGTIREVQKDGWVQVRVTQVQKGSTLKVGDTIIVSASTYTKPGDQGLMSKPLEAGDTLFWFLKRDPQKAGEGETWSPLPGGAKLVFNGHVAEFSQHYMNPGPVVAEVEEEYVKRGQPTVEEYQRTIKTSLDYVSASEKDLQAATRAKDSKKLLAMLREHATRIGSHAWGIDEIGNSIGQALADTHDYPVLDEALKMEGLRGGTQFLQGFATADGIQYLLAKITDTKLSSKERIAYLNALPPYQWLPREGGLTPQPGFYLANMAKWAVENEKDRALSQTFMNVVGSWAGNSDRFDRQTRDDLYDAMDTLKAFYRSRKDPAVQFQIEIIARDVGDAMYASLKSRCGPIISMVTMPEDLANYAKPEGRDIIASLTYSFAFADEGEHTITHEPILLGADGVAHRASYYSTNRRFRPGTLQNSLGLHNSSGFTCPIRPPADLPAGKYQLFVRFQEGGRVIGESHAVEVELPDPQ